MASTSLISGISGLQASQTALNVIGDNLANLNTNGFKTARVSFATSLSQSIRSASGPSGGLGGTNPIEIGTGTSVASIDKAYTQGNMLPTGRPLDLGIEGDSFFILTDTFSDFYTRVGAFNLDKNNDLVDTGTGLKVKSTNGGAINVPVNDSVPGRATTVSTIAGNLDTNFNTGAVTHVLTTNAPFTTAGPGAAVAADGLNTRLQNGVNYVAGDQIDINGTEHDGVTVSKRFVYGGGAGQDGTTLGDLRDFINASYGSAVTTIDGSGNLVLAATPPGASDLTLTIADATGNTGASTFGNFAITTSGVGDVYVTTIPIFDIQGSSHLVSLTFEKTAENTWDLTPTMNPDKGSVTDSVTAINFNKNGSFSSVTGTAAITITYPDTSTQTINLDFGLPTAFNGLTQFGGTPSAAGVEQDGHEEGLFASTSINSDGNVLASFTNGQSKNVGQIQLALFSNPSGLSSVGGNLLQTSIASGDAILKTAQPGKVGSIKNGVLESSNVDIAEEFTKLIVAQRSFQANARTITTTDEIMQELVSIVR